MKTNEHTIKFCAPLSTLPYNLDIQGAILLSICDRRGKCQAEICHHDTRGHRYQWLSGTVEIPLEAHPLKGGLLPITNNVNKN
jgi:hypothetical protein